MIRISQRIIWFFGFACLASSAFCKPVAEATHSEAKVGMIGDSFALGFFSHPSLSIASETLAQVLRGERSVQAKEDSRLSAFSIKADPDSPTILWPRAIREYLGSSDWTVSHTIGSFALSFFSTPSYAWPYLLGTKKEYASKNILVSADMNAKVDKLPRLLDRILDANKNELPSELFIFFTENDICASSLSFVTASESFGDSLLTGLQYLVRNGKTPKQGVKVYIPHHLPLIQLITNEDILARKLDSSEMGCRELRKRGFQISKKETLENTSVESLYVSILLPTYYSGRCSSLLNQDLLASEQVSFFSSFNENKRENELKEIKAKILSSISTRIRNYREQTELAVKEANIWRKKQFPEKDIQFFSIKETANINFDAQDISDDCFHPNLNGQIKITKALLAQ